MAFISPLIKLFSFAIKLNVDSPSLITSIPFSSPTTTILVPSSVDLASKLKVLILSPTPDDIEIEPLVK